MPITLMHDSDKGLIAAQQAVLSNAQHIASSSVAASSSSADVKKKRCHIVNTAKKI
ncbi:hypothetical protein LPJ64_004857 [Coemansia asiatica]|uniref:Uncharacterized protein n=1 Tax=Coemansia asiatica TaxID=1052880 RepID=A0A9W8CHH3_9FUNG|nr:hypothetical protein LPJ64_004857 [Coemansia asiatica]